MLLAGAQDCYVYLCLPVYCVRLFTTLYISALHHNLAFSIPALVPGTPLLPSAEVICAIQNVVDNPGVDAEVSKLPELCPGQGNMDFPALPLLFHCT